MVGGLASSSITILSSAVRTTFLDLVIKRSSGELLLP